MGNALEVEGLTAGFGRTEVMTRLAERCERGGAF